MNSPKRIVLAVLLIFSLLLAILGVLYMNGRLPWCNLSSYRRGGSSSTSLQGSAWSYTTRSTRESGQSTTSQGIGLIKPLEESERLCIEFMASKMITREGAVYSTFRRGYGRSTIYGVNHEVTAESIGLLMLYALKEGDKALFDREALFLEKRLLSPLGICYWKLREDLSPFRDKDYASSASIDDLRIIEALIEGYNLWGDEHYISLAYTVMDGVFKYEVARPANILVDYYTWRNSRGEKAETLTLAYARLPSLLKMKRLDGRWIKVFNETLRVVLEGSRGPAQLFYPKYEVMSRRYMDGPADTIEELTTAINLAEIGEEEKADAIYRFLKEDYLRRGFISDSYTFRGQGSPSDAGVGAYSLLARLALKLGDRNLALKIIYEKILTVQERNPDSEYYGAFMNQWPTDRLDANAYDNLQALLTLNEAVKDLEKPSSSKGAPDPSKDAFHGYIHSHPIFQLSVPNLQCLERLRDLSPL